MIVIISDFCIMDKFVKRYDTSEESLPRAWKLCPLPKSSPKRPVGRPPKRKLDIPADDSSNSAKRVCVVSNSNAECDVVINSVGINVSSTLDSTANSPTVNKECEVTSTLDSNKDCEATGTLTKDNTTSSSSSKVSDSDGSSNERLSIIRGHYKHFNRQQKREVKEYVKWHGIRAAAKHFKIPRSTVNNLNKTDFDDDNLRDKNGCIMKPGRNLSYPEEFDFKILAYVLEQRELQNAVTIEDICIYASEVMKPVVPGFMASRGWAASFMKRNDLSLRTRTSLA